MFFPFSIKTSKCSGSCNNSNNPYAKLCVRNATKNLSSIQSNVRNQKTRHIKWYEKCKCKCKLNGSACNDKQRSNDDKCRCECKELIDKDVCDKGFIWKLSNCECECYKSREFSEYLDYKNCKCKKTVDKLLEHSSAEEYIDQVKIIEMTLFEHGNECVCSYTMFVVLAAIVLTISIGTGAYFVYSCWYLKNNVSYVQFGTRTQTTI